MRLIIGNKNYSSWSLRAWLLMATYDLEFEEVKVLLGQPDSSENIGKYNKALKVPALHDGDLVVWDSLAICEYISEKYLGGKGWPKSELARATARSCSAEMHSGFFALREQMPMNCRAEGRRVEQGKELVKEIQRIDQIWSEYRGIYSAEGPFLFGEFSIADCMFAPVVFRLNTYGVQVSEESRQYMNTILQHPKVKEWLEEAKLETEIIEYAELGK